MTSNYYNLVRFLTATTGDSDVTVGAAVPGCITPALAGVSDSEDVEYGLITYSPTTRQPIGGEVGLGRYISSGPTFKRTTVYTSTDSDNSAIDLTGVTQIYFTPAAIALNRFVGTTPLFDYTTDVGNVGTGEDNLYTDNLAASQFLSNGDKVRVEYSGIFVGHATATREIKLKFNSSTIFDTGALAISSNSSWYLRALLIRVSSSVLRYAVEFETQNAPLSAYTNTGELTSLDFTTVKAVLLTGEAAGVGAATNDIVAKLGSISYMRHA